MSTSKVLQKPKIIEIIGSTIRVAHPDISRNIKTSLATQIAAAGTAMSVLDNTGFADNDWFIAGAVGDSETEECDVNGAVTKGQSLTVTNTLKFGHELDAPITKIYERGIKIYGAATDGGAGTLIASIDAIVAAANQIADAQMIQWNRQYTEYTLISTDTTYAYYFVKFTDGTTDSDASDYVLASGVAANAVQKFIDQAINITGAKIGEKITRQMCVGWADDCQSAISQYVYQDPVSGEYMQMDWDFEVTDDQTTITTSENENKFSLSGLSLKYPNSSKSILTVSIGDQAPLKRISLDDYVDSQKGVARTELAAAANAADTSITVDSNVIFNDEGTLYLGSDTITYTGKTGTTVFTGIPAAGTGAITGLSSIDAPVWQGVAPGLPEKWVIDQENILFERPVSSSYASWPVYFRFYKKLTPLTEESDTTEVTFTNVFQYYIGSMIEQRRGNLERADKLMKKFNNKVLQNALKNQSPTTDEYTYFEYNDYLP